MTDTELFNTLALMRVEGVGDIVAKKLVNHLGCAEEVFKAKKSQITAIEGIGDVMYNNLKKADTFKLAEAEVKFVRENNIKPLYYQDKHYPDRLKHCIDGPVVLFTSGNINIENRKTISIVGTRQMTAYGADFCRKFIEDLAPLNPVIVSGFAYGVDIHAHTVAIDHGLQTIGVVAHGLNQVYPKVHKKYVAKMEENGGFMTEFWSTSNPDKENFVRRNRIVAGISEATIIIESADKGGSLITANIANDYNRDVFAVPGRITDKYSMGCNSLIKSQRANLLTNAADLIYMLNWQLEEENKKPVQNSFLLNSTTRNKKYMTIYRKMGKSSWML